MSPDAVVVGSGPNGLAAAVVLARAGLSVHVIEAADRIGGGARSEPLFDADVVHDLCSAVHPLAAASRFFREFGLAERVELCAPEVSYAHPLTSGASTTSAGGPRTALAYRDLDRTCDRLGVDGPRWRALMAPLAERGERVVELLLSDQRRLPRNLTTPLALATRTLTHGTRLGTRTFSRDHAPALLAGVAAHAMGPLPSLPGAVTALLLGHLAHTTGWPVPRGGSASIVAALAAEITAHGGTIETGTRVNDLRALQASTGARAVLLDVGAAEFARIAHPVLPERYRKRLARFRAGPGVCKVDFLVAEPIPWTDQDISRAGTVHLGGTRAEVFAAENAPARGYRAHRPFVLLADPAVADPTREVAGKRPVWAYCHVPHGDPRDAADAIQARIEEFAPGFGDTLLARRSMTAPELARGNPNYVGGDIAAGAVSVRQSLARPTLQWHPHRTPLRGVYLCSASTLPGPGVHGMAGYHAARDALRREFDGTATTP